MKITCGIISQNHHMKEQLKFQLNQLEIFNVSWFANDEQDFYKQTFKNIPEVIFIDLDNYHLENPMLLLREIYDLEAPSSKVIAISSNKKLAYNCIKLNVFDFLLNPLSDYELVKCIQKLRGIIQEKKSKICLRAKSDYQYVDLADILYLRADNNYTDFHLINGKKITGFDSLKTFETLLPEGFLRIHKSYIINISQVSRINFGKSHISLKQVGPDLKIPFSDKYKLYVKNFNENLVQKHFSTLTN